MSASDAPSSRGHGPVPRGGGDRSEALDVEPAPLRFSREGMRQVDRQAMDVLGIPGLLLMERAALGLAREVAALLGAGGPSRVVCLCGPGGNGGDGWAAARQLHCAGVAVAAIEVAAAAPSSDAGVNRRLARAVGVPEVTLASWQPRGEVVVDALLGTGGSRPPEGAVLAGIEHICAAADAGCTVVSADIPSGLDADTGRWSGAVVEAAVTVTFAGIKQGLLEPAAQRKVGRLVVVPIGVPRSLLERHAIAAERGRS